MRGLLSWEYVGTSRAERSMLQGTVLRVFLKVPVLKKQEADPGATKAMLG